MSPLAQLFERLGYVFNDEALIEAALTHRSAGGSHNERLEFLGDAVLDLVISDELYARVPQASEGGLSRLRASLVRRDSLADTALELDLGEFLKLGAGELRSGGFRRKSILADALEAIIGALYLDGGYAAARDCIARLFARRLAQLPDPDELRDAKTRLQELLQARGSERPEYEVAEVTGAPHEQHFEVTCRIAGLDVTTKGSGTSRRRAEQNAAALALEQIGARDTAS